MTPANALWCYGQVESTDRCTLWVTTKDNFPISSRWATCYPGTSRGVTVTGYFCIAGLVYAWCGFVRLNWHLQVRRVHYIPISHCCQEVFGIYLTQARGSSVQALQYLPCQIIKRVATSIYPSGCEYVIWGHKLFLQTLHCPRAFIMGRKDFYTPSITWDPFIKVLPSVKTQ